jgi:hypothetical protein
MVAWAGYVALMGKIKDASETLNVKDHFRDSEMNGNCIKIVLQITHYISHLRMSLWAETCSEYQRK